MLLMASGQPPYWILRFVCFIRLDECVRKTGPERRAKSTLALQSLSCLLQVGLLLLKHYHLSLVSQHIITSSQLSSSSSAANSMDVVLKVVRHLGHRATNAQHPPHLHMECILASLEPLSLSLMFK